MKFLGIAGVAAATLLGWHVLERPEAPVPLPLTVTVPAGSVQWRPQGSFSHGGKAVTPAAAPVDVADFVIMAHQVTQTDYAACVEAGACLPAGFPGDGEAPQVQVSWHDATAYAAWLGQATGTRWRLPTDIEWQRAAGDPWVDADALPGGADPGARMLAEYKAGLLLRARTAPSADMPNALGLHGTGDDIWEWTDTCMVNGEVDAAGHVLSSAPYCSVRVAGGRHPALLIDFIRDASVGGCAAGLPPDHLGFRLVRAD